MNIQDKITKLQLGIRSACAKSERDPQKVKLIAATKYAGAEEINQAIKAGLRAIGENRIQDAQKKLPQLLPVTKHFIGHLQSNKVKLAVELFDCIESVDSVSLAEKIDAECSRQGKVMPIFLEINIANDPHKFGLPPASTISTLEKISSLKNIQSTGLMTIVPYAPDPELSRRHFNAMKKLFDSCFANFSQLQTLSMGMSHDYTVALEEGANEIRIGSLIFQ